MFVTTLYRRPCWSKVRIVSVSSMTPLRLSRETPARTKSPNVNEFSCLLIVGNGMTVGAGVAGGCDPQAENTRPNTVSRLSQKVSLCKDFLDMRILLCSLSSDLRLKLNASNLWIMCAFALSNTILAPCREKVLITPRDGISDRCWSTFARTDKRVFSCIFSFFVLGFLFFELTDCVKFISPRTRDEIIALYFFLLCKFPRSTQWAVLCRVGKSTISNT